MRFATFLEGAAGSLFCTGARHQKRGGRKVLIIPPFAEELNKSRHILASICRALGDAGHDVVLPDLYGTGDSEGQFGDATLDIWRSDLDVAIRHLRPGQDLELIALRFGALLAADLVARHPVRSITLLHPIAEGRQQLTQMLRLRLAGALLEGKGGQRETAAQLKQRLAAGECLEIAGYELSGRLAADLETLSLAGSVPIGVGQVRWIELAHEADRPLMPVSARIIDAWRGAGIPVDTALLACDQFWATQEIAQCPALVRETVGTFSG